MVFSYNWLKDYIKDLPQPEKLADLLTTHSFEVIEVKKAGEDWVLDIDILPNRAADCFSHIGVAREISAITKLSLQTSDVCQFDRRPTSVAAKRQSPVSVEVKHSWACPRYTLGFLSDVKVKPSPVWLRNRLKACGLNSINNIVDIANYVMLEIGQPLHAFDGEQLQGGKIIVRFAEAKEKMITLDNQKFNLDSDILVIADAVNPVAIAGPGGKQGLMDIYPKKVYPGIIKLDLSYVNSLLGAEISPTEIKRILESLGFKIKNWKLKIWTVEAPTMRLDIILPEDLIEEVGRIYGYEKIPAVLPIASLIPPKRNDSRFWEDMVKDGLREAGFTEAYNYSFVSQDGKAIEVLNPISSEFKYLRPSLIPNLLKNIEKNVRNFGKIKIFELGTIFTGNTEKKMLTAVALGEDFYQLKGAVDLIFEKLGISDVWYDNYQASPEESQKSFWHPTKCAEIKVGQQELGFLGELSVRAFAHLKIPAGVVAFDINFEKLQQLASEETIYRPLSKFPAAIRDIAVLVPLRIRVEEVLNKIELAGGKLLKDVDLFDIYEGGELPGDKKNLAFHLIYQAQDRTLTSEEVDKIHQKIIKTLEKESTWQVRK